MMNGGSSFKYLVFVFVWIPCCIMAWALLSQGNGYVLLALLPLASLLTIAVYSKLFDPPSGRSEGIALPKRRSR